MQVVKYVGYALFFVVMLVFGLYYTFPWESAKDRSIYAVSLHALQKAVGQQPVFDVIGFDEGAEAVTAPYNALRLVIVEYGTPQIAQSNDERINERIKQLSESGQPVPSSYRRAAVRSGRSRSTQGDARERSIQLLPAKSLMEKIGGLG